MLSLQNLFLEQNMKVTSLELPKKKICFVVYYPYQWFIYKNIYFKLPVDLREVIVDSTVHPRLQTEDLKNDIFSLLESDDVNFRVIDSLKYLDKNYVSSLFSNVEVIVSCWEMGCVSNKHVSHIKKVNTTYGIAKELTMIRPSRSIYDLILAYGERDRNYFSLMTRSIAIGNPRMDNFFLGKKNNTKEKISSFFKDRKKILVYAPTHGDLSSYQEMFEEIKKITEDYNVVFKPHYYSLREDKDFIEKYKLTEGVMVLDDTWDTIDVLASADVVLSDNSSVIFDAMQVDKPIILCDFLDNNFIDNIHKNLRFMKRGVVGASTYSGSLEQEIKEKGMILSIKTPSGIKHALENIDLLDEKYRKFRKEIVDEHFKFIDGKSSERAAEAIMQIYGNQRKHSPGILHHAYMAYNNRRYRSTVNSNSTGSMEVNFSNIVAWVFLDNDSKIEEVLATVYSLLGKENISCIYVSGMNKEKTGEIERDLVSSKVMFFNHHKECIDKILSQTKGQLLIIRSNTKVKRIDNIINIKMVCKRRVLFFARNLIYNNDEEFSRAYFLLKKEIIGTNLFSNTDIFSVSYPQIQSIEKSAILIDSDVIKKTILVINNSISFENLISLVISLESLESFNFKLMPNIFTDHFEVKQNDIKEVLILKGIYLNKVGVSIRDWPDKKIIKYLLKIFSGDFQYLIILKIVFFKIIGVMKYLFMVKSEKILVSLNRKIEKFSRI